MNKEIEKIILKVLRYGMSAALALLGILLMYLGAIGKAVRPESFYAGGFILLVSLVYLFSEWSLKLVEILKVAKVEKKKIKHIQEVASVVKELNKNQKIVVRHGCSCLDEVKE